MTTEPDDRLPGMVSPGRVRAVQLPKATTLRERLNISRLALAHPRTTLVAWALVALAGIAAYQRLPLALFPDVTFPLVVVTAEGATGDPAATEQAITIPIEQRIRPLRDLKNLQSSTSAGKVMVAAEFEVGVSLAAAQHRVDSALASLVLPGGAHPSTRPVDINESPVVTYVMVGEYRTPEQLMGTALGTFLPALQKVPGVLRVVPLGMDPAAVAELSKTAVDTALPHTVAWLNGQRGVALEVVKEAGANTIDVVHAVDSVVRVLQADNPDIHLVPAVTQADFITASTTATTDALCAPLGVSRRQLERRFRADVGLSPADYRQQLRLRRARWLLQNTDLAVTEVGLQCGYQDASGFARAVRRAFGASPSALRAGTGDR